MAEQHEADKIYRQTVLERLLNLEKGEVLAKQFTQMEKNLSDKIEKSLSGVINNNNNDHQNALPAEVLVTKAAHDAVGRT